MGYAKVPKHPNLVFDKDSLIVYELENGKPSTAVGTYDKTTKKFIESLDEKEPEEEPESEEDSEEKIEPEIEPEEPENEENVSDIVDNTTSTNVTLPSVTLSSVNPSSITLPSVIEFLNTLNDKGYVDEEKYNDLQERLTNAEAEKDKIEEKYKSLKVKFAKMIEDL